MLTHPFVVGELACSNLKERENVLHLQKRLPAVRKATDSEVFDLIERRNLAGRDIGFTDAHLLAGCLLTPGTLFWTLDPEAAAAARILNIAFEESRMDLTEYIHSALAGLPVREAILFGSRAEGGEGEGSDVDLIVVLDREAPVQTFEERMALQVQVRSALHELSERHGLDVLVYTLPEYRQFLASGSCFSRTVQESGKVVYEAAG